MKIKFNSFSGVFLALAFFGMLISAGASAQEQANRYASVRGWAINYYTDNRGFLGCDAQIGRGGQYLRIGFDTNNRYWAIGIRTSQQGDFPGDIEIDGRYAHVTFRHFPDGWAMVQLSNSEIGEVKKGSTIGINTGNGYVNFSLSGSTAAILKVQECSNLKGRRPQKRVVQNQTVQPRIAPTLSAPPTTAPASTNKCRVGEQFLPESGLCSDKARRLLRIAASGSSVYLDNGCQLAVNETRMAGGEIMLYKAARCNGKTAKLTFSAGAKFGELSGDGLNAVAAYLDGQDGGGAVLFRAKSVMESGDRKNKCHVQSGKAYGYPDDSLVVNDVDFNQFKVDSQKGPGEGGGFCGKWGVFSDSNSYWRVIGDNAWFFEFGQDVVLFDGSTFTAIAKDAQGVWRAMK